MLGKICKMASIMRPAFVYVLIFYVFLFVSSSADDVNNCNSYNGKCTCSDTRLECRNAGIKSISDLSQFVTENVTYISITENDIFEIPEYLFSNCDQGAPWLVNLKYLDLSSNNINNIERFSFSCLPNLETLKLAHNVWNIDGFQADYFSPLTKLVHLDLQDAFVESVVANQIRALLTDGQIIGLETLDLSSNELGSVSLEFGTTLCEIFPLLSLNMSHNSLSEPLIRECMTNLQTLDLSSNNISSFTPQFMDVLEAMLNLKTVYLDNNPYSCDCSLLDTYDWLTTTGQPLNKADLICYTGYNDTYVGRTILSLEDSDLHCEEPKIVVCYGPNGPIALARSTIVYILIAAGLLTSLVVVVCLVAVIRRKNLAARGLKYNNNNVQINGEKGAVYTRMV